MTVRATEVVDAVGPILADANLPIGIGDLVDKVHRRVGWVYLVCLVERHRPAQIDQIDQANQNRA